MIRQMEELGTFVTLCYGRFDNRKNEFSFVDCGHVRTLFYRKREETVHLLSGENMPIGFPDPMPPKAFSVSYEPGDFFLFYSDGLTEAANPGGERYEEERLVGFVRENSDLPPDRLVQAVREHVVNFTGTEIFTDDFTCVVVRIRYTGEPGLVRGKSFVFESSLKNLRMMRNFIREFTNGLSSGPLDDVRATQVEVAATEVVTNIIKHAYGGEEGLPIEMTAEEYDGKIVLSFVDTGKTFDPSTVAPPVLDGTQESGMGCYIISQIADDVLYFRDKLEGKNCARITIAIE